MLHQYISLNPIKNFLDVLQFIKHLFVPFFCLFILACCVLIDYCIILPKMQKYPFSFHVIPGLILKKLQIIKSVNLEQERECGKSERLKISFDLYLPSATFRKASPGLPNYRITVVGYS